MSGCGAESGLISLDQALDKMIFIGTSFDRFAYILYRIYGGNMNLCSYTTRFYSR